MRKSKVTILKGLPASGKSTWAIDEVKNGQGNVKRVNKDDLRIMVDGGKYSKEREQFILKLRDNIIIDAMFNRKDIIVDDTNLHPKHEQHIRDLVEKFIRSNNGVGKVFDNFEPYDIEVEVKDFPISLDEAIARDSKRGDKSVGAEVIFRMHQQFIRPQYQVTQNPQLPKAIICDLDGTLALHTNRGPFEYDKCDTDTVNEPLRFLIEQITGDGGTHYDVIFLSGREDSCRAKTVDWLVKHLDFTKEYIEKNLFMRKAGDTRKDYVIKREMFDAHVKDKYYINFVLDDRNQVVNLWRDLGLTCFQVADGYF